MISYGNLSNCRNTLKPTKLQHNHEIRIGANCREIKKNSWMSYGVSLSDNKNGRSAAKPRKEEGSTTIPLGSRIASDWQFEMVNMYIMHYL